MIALTEGQVAELEARSGVVARVLLWITARDRTTGDPATLGLWSGTGSRAFTINGEARTYHGPALGVLPPISGGIGLAVREYRVPVPHLTPEVQSLLADYDTRLAAVEIHSVLFNRASRALLGPPQQRFVGWIDKFPLTTGAAGGQGGGELVLVSAARGLTRSPALFRADADQQARATGDLFRKYSAGVVLKEVRWGQANVKAKSEMTFGGTVPGVGILK